VLRPGGRYAFTVWSAPAKAKVLSLIGEAVQRHADPSITPPAGPNMFMLSDAWASTAVMDAAGFAEIRVEELSCHFAAASPAELFDMMRKSMVRATYVYDRQSVDVQRRIEQTIHAEAAAALAAGAGRIPCPALLVSGIKAGA
jgi:hypothetical protein